MEDCYVALSAVDHFVVFYCACRELRDIGEDPKLSKPTSSSRGSNFIADNNSPLHAPLPAKRQSTANLPNRDVDMFSAAGTQGDVILRNSNCSWILRAPPFRLIGTGNYSIFSEHNVGYLEMIYSDQVGLRLGGLVSNRTETH
jgi:hypothetical protein